MRILNETHIEGFSLTGLEIADLIEATLVEQGNLAGLKTQVSFDNGNYFQALPAALEHRNLVTVKWVSVQGTAPEHPRIQAACLVSDGHSGKLRGLVSFDHLTALRTAAMSLVALRVLPFKPKQPRIGFIGVGVQAKAHLRVFAHHFAHHAAAFSEILAYAPAAPALAGFERFLETAAPNVRLTTCRDARELIEASDIVVSSVPAGVEVVTQSLGLLRRGCFAALPDLGRSWTPHSRGTDQVLITDGMKQSAELIKAGKMKLTDAFDWDLSALLASRPALSEDKAYVFAFGGLGICDALVAAHCLALAERSDTGVNVDF